MRLKKLKNVRSEYTDRRTKKDAENTDGRYRILLVVIIAVLLLAGIAAGILVAGRNAKKQAAVKDSIPQENDSITAAIDLTGAEDVSGELTSLQEYLTKLDQMILDNRGKLDEVIASNDALGRTIDLSSVEQMMEQLETMEHSYTELFDLFDGYEEAFAAYLEKYVSDEQFSDYLENYVATTQMTHTGIVNLHSALMEAKKEITAGKNLIVNTLESMGNSGGIDTSTLDKLVSAADSISVTNTRIRDIEKEIQNLVSELNTVSEENRTEITETLESLKTELEQAMAADMTVIERNFTDLSDSLTAVLEKTQELDVQTKTAVTEMKEAYAVLSKLVTDAALTFESFLSEYAEDIEVSGVKLDEISSSVAEMDKLLSYTEQELTAALETMREDDKLRQDELKQLINGLDYSVNSVKELLAKTDSGIQNALSGMDAEEKKNHAELVSALESLQSSILDTMKAEFERIDQDFELLQALTEKNFSALKEDLDTSVLGLNDQLSSIHGQIVATQGEIVNLLQSMNEKEDQQYNALLEAIETSVDEINGNVDLAYGNLQALIRMLNADVAQARVDASEDHTEILETLKEMEGDMSDSMSADLEQLNSSFTDLKDDLDTYFNQVKEEQGGIDTAVGELGTDLKTALASMLTSVLDALTAHDTANKTGQDEIKNAIQTHDANMLLGHENLEGKIDAHNNEMKISLDTYKNELAQQLESVFTSVSSGKNLLASTLLTKGVSVEADATFQELADAILGISQEIKVDQMPGKIAYDYHYHTDANGKELHTDTNSVPGGCYTVTSYHSHIGSCYSSEVCGGSVEYRTDREHYWCNEENACVEHGCWWEAPNSTYPVGCWHCNCPEHTVSVCKSCGAINAGNPCSKTVTKQVCGKNSSALEAYQVGCGLSDGQIVAAHIVFYDSVSAASAMSLREEPAAAMEAEAAVSDENMAAADENAADVEPEAKQQTVETKETETVGKESGVTEPAVEEPGAEEPGAEESGVTEPAVTEPAAEETESGAEEAEAAAQKTAEEPEEKTEETETESDAVQLQPEEIVNVSGNSIR